MKDKPNHHNFSGLVCPFLLYLEQHLWLPSAWILSLSGLWKYCMPRFWKIKIYNSFELSPLHVSYFHSEFSRQNVIDCWLGDRKTFSFWSNESTRKNFCRFFYQRRILIIFVIRIQRKHFYALSLSISMMRKHPVYLFYFLCIVLIRFRCWQSLSQDYFHPF